MNGNWGWVNGLHDNWCLDLDGRGVGRGIGTFGGLGPWLVGLDTGAVAEGIGDVVDDTGSNIDVHVTVGSDLVVVHVSGLLASKAGAEVIDVVVVEALPLWYLLSSEKCMNVVIIN